MVQVDADKAIDKVVLVLLVVLGALAANYVLANGINTIVTTLVSAF